MPSLMTIPRELRDQICNHVIFSPAVERPSLDQTFEELVEGGVLYKWPNVHNEGALYRPRNEVTNAGSLLLVNHQINAEVKQNLERIKATYDLDIIMLDDIVPLATWTSVPYLTTKVEQVNATFRISGSYQYEKSRPRRNQPDGTPAGPYARVGHFMGWRGGDGGPPGIYWQMYSILERFIRVGPLGERTEEKEHRHFTVKTLNINVETPPSIDPSRFRQPRHAGNSRRNLIENGVLDPEYLTKFLHNLIRGLISSRDREWFGYGQILYEHVDEVVVSKDGVKVYKADVAERLRDIDGFDERYWTKERLRKYKEGAWDFRRKMGLKVLPKE